MASDGLQWASLADVSPEAPRWLWQGRVPLGGVTIIGGKKGRGKTSVAAAIAASLLGGAKLPGETKRQSGCVCWATIEESYGGAVRPRLELAGAKVSGVWYPTRGPADAFPRSLDLPNGLGQLEASMEQRDCRLAVLDPLSSHIAAGWSMNDGQQARTVVQGLGQVAQAVGGCVLCVQHDRKSAVGGALDRGLGSADIVNCARSVLRCDFHPDKEDVFVLSHVALNGGVLSPSLTFTLHGPATVAKVKWGEVVLLDADALAEPAGETGERDERVDARRLLYQLLKDGKKTCKDVLLAAREAGVGERRLRAAKAELRIESSAVYYGGSLCWEWNPPANGWPDDLREE